MSLLFNAYKMAACTVILHVAFLQHAKASADWDNDLNLAWQAIAEEKFSPTYSDVEHYGAVQSISMNSFPDDASIAAVRLWVIGDMNQLIVSWVEQNNRASRIIIASLLTLSMSEFSETTRLRLAAINARFNKEESALRAMELDYINLHKSEIAGKIVRALKSVVDDKRLNGFRLTAHPPKK